MTRKGDSGHRRASTAVGYAAAAIVVVIVISATAFGIVELQLSAQYAQPKYTTTTQTATVTQSYTTTSLSVSTVTSTSVSISTTTQTVTSVAAAVPVSIVLVALRAADFLTGGTTTTFTCASAVTGSYIALTNTGTTGVSVIDVSIMWAGVNNHFVGAGTCNIGASGSATATEYIIFPATTKMTPSAVVGQPFQLVVTLSNGSQLLSITNFQ